MKRENQNFSKMEIDERKHLVEHLYVIYPRNSEILSKFAYCHQHAKLATEPEGMLLEGPTGMGKTTLCKYYSQGFQRVVTKNGVVVPVLAARVQVPASPKSLVTVLLKSLGDPLPDKGTTVSQTLRLKEMMEECGTELVILDEFQHFIDRDSKKVLKTISDWLKNLMDDTKKPIILIGMPYSHTILDAQGNEQLQRRFSVRIKLEPFDWLKPDDRKDFRRFLRIVDEKLPFNEWSNLSDTNMAFRFYLASGGVVSKVMKLIRRAAVISLDLAREKLDLDTLSLAYEDCLAANVPEKGNPFDDCSSALKPKTTKDKSAMAATNARSKAKGEKLKASDVL